MGITREARPQTADLDALSDEVLSLHERVLALEAELERAGEALDDPSYLSGRLHRLLADHPDLRGLARHIQEQLTADARQDSPMG